MHKTQGLGGFTARSPSGPYPQNFLLLAGEPALSGAQRRCQLRRARVD